ncbi:hypothetical protein TMA_110 [Thermus phage TMA]|uniref:glycosyltransferase n=1 Tax=Thermus phage TMA TaxID=699370 RepID=UPI00021AADDF|nr:glycosyltransferase [Thermus phage TMA]BAK53798.1 hypothetical protein TMA_110 [Thermus phage TMA]
MNKIWKWEMIADLDEYYVGASHYFMNEIGGEDSKEIYDSFKMRIVSNPKFEDFYKVLEHAERLYCYLHTFLPNEQDMFYINIETNIRGKRLNPKRFKALPNDDEKYSDYLLRNINEFFKQALPELLENNVKRPEIHAAIYRKRKVDTYNGYKVYSDYFYEYIFLEIILKLRLNKEVI